jgi:phage terminase large subunit-like protein
MIPRDRILGVRMKAGMPDAVDTVYVRHVSGGISVISFKAAQEGRGSFQGTAQHWIHIDEEPELDSMGIYEECMMRTATTNGQVLFTFTPLLGMNELCRTLINEGKAGKAHVTYITWEDCPHLDEDTKQDLISRMRPHQIKARTEGIPFIGDGIIYPFGDEILADPIREIPRHWRLVSGMDVARFNGWTARVLLAHNPTTGVWYLCREYKEERCPREQHYRDVKASWGEGTQNVYTAMDPSANITEVDGRETMRVYKSLGLNVHNANNGVDAGIQQVYELFSDGRLKICRDMRKSLEEIQTYELEDGKIVKKNDHLMDALRYAVMAIGQARTIAFFRQNQGTGHGTRKWQPIDAAVGY